MSKRRKQTDYVLGLISGRFETSKTYNEDGERVIATVFIPMVTNPHPTLSQLAKTDCVDMSAQQIMQREGLINPPLIINRAEFSKSAVEKKELKIKKQQSKAFDKRTNRKYTTYDFQTWQYAMKVNSKVA